MANRESLTEAYHRLTSITMNGAGKIASESFLGLKSWREVDIDRFMSSVVPGIDNAKRTMANYTTGYYGKIAQAERQAFKAVSVPATQLATEAIRNGTTSRMIWERPFKEMWTQLSQGADFSDALNAGARRADWTARTEIQLAKREAGLTVRNGNTNIVGYLRTLSGAENCGLCYLASTQRYNRGELLPIHPGCDCGETPIFGNTDVGQIVDEQTLNATHEAVSERFGKFDVSGREIDYRQITIVDHGELGPYLTVKGHEFTKVKPQDLTAAIKAPKPVPASAKLTFAASLKPKLDRISGTTIANDVKLEHGSVSVQSLKGKAKVQTLGPKTAAHLDAVKEVGKDIDKEIQNRVKAEINNLADPVAIAKAEKQIKGNEALIRNAKVKYEAGYQSQIAIEQAKIEARGRARLAELARDGFDQDYLEEYARKFYNPEKILREAQSNAETVYKFTPAGREILREIDSYQKEIIQFQQAIPANVIPGTERYNQIFSAKAKEVLSEVKSLGTGGPKFIGDSKANEILEKAKAFYPDSWLESAEKKYGNIGTKSVSRGYFNEFTGTIAVSYAKSKGFENGLSTAIHELGHMFETTVPGLKETQFAFAHQRAALNPRRSKLGSKEAGFEDLWRNLYTGKDYGYEVDSNYEIFTTGVESVFTGSDLWSYESAVTNSNYRNGYLPSTIPIDDEFRQFILGVMFAL